MTTHGDGRDSRRLAALGSDDASLYVASGRRNRKRTANLQADGDVARGQRRRKRTASMACLTSSVADGSGICPRFATSSVPARAEVTGTGRSAADGWQRMGTRSVALLAWRGMAHGDAPSGGTHGRKACLAAKARLTGREGASHGRRRVPRATARLADQGGTHGAWRRFCLGGVVFRLVAAFHFVGFALLFVSLLSAVIP
ncbi:unnamed protein product [Closterium sp. NIES-53]